MKTLTLIALLTASLAHAAEAPDVLTALEAQARSTRVSKVTYDIQLAVTEKAKTYHGLVSIAFTLDAANADLRVDFRSSGIKSIKANGTAVTAPGADSTRFAVPAAALKPGANTIVVEYDSGYDSSGSGFHQFIDPVDQHEYIFSDFEPYYAHRLFPCFDQPDLKATYAVAFTAPRGWEVIANAPEVRSAPDGNGVRHEFERTPALSTYLMFVGCGPFAKFTDAKAKVPAHIYTRQSLKAYCRADAIFDTTRRGLAFYGEFFGTPYPFKKYDQIFVPEFNSGAMENPGAVTFNERRLFRHEPTRAELLEMANVILHEMAHMWFGDLVTMRWWDGLWLNESFADYMACVSMVKATEYKEAFEDFLVHEKARAYREDQHATTHPVAGSVTDTDTAFSNFDGITYGKGASLLKQLEFLLGEAAFRRGLAAYFRAHAWKNTETRDFFDAMSAAAGRPLADWAALQFKTTGVNGVAARAEDKAGKITGFSIEQTPGNGDAKLKDHRLEVAAYHAAANGRLVLHKVVAVTLAGAHTRVPELVGTTPYAFVWPNFQDQAYVKVALDPRSLDYALKHLELLPDGLTRRGVWITFGEMVRDGQLAPAAYVEAFIAKAPLEPDPQVVEGQFVKLKEVLDHYLPQNRAELVARVHETAYRECEKAKEGSDAQKTWFDLAATTAVTPAALARFADLLDGKRQIRGFTLDQEKRWALVIRLAASGAKDATARIAAESKRDPTSMGQLFALTAEASQPIAAVKADIWKRAVEERKVSLEQIKAMMRGFHQPDAPELSQPYVAKFYDAAVMLKAAAEQELNEAFAETMFPQYVFDPAVVQRTNEFLTAHRELSFDVRRPIADQADDLRRALTIRAAARPGKK